MHNDTDTPSTSLELEKDDAYRYRFPSTRTWKGEKVPASGVREYRTVDDQDSITVEFVDTPEGAIMVIDGRPISLDDTHRLMTAVALYRHETDAVSAFISRREAKNR